MKVTRIKARRNTQYRKLWHFEVSYTIGRKSDTERFERFTWDNNEYSATFSDDVPQYHRDCLEEIAEAYVTLAMYGAISA